MNGNKHTGRNVETGRAPSLPADVCCGGSRVGLTYKVACHHTLNQHNTSCKTIYNCHLFVNYRAGIRSVMFLYIITLANGIIIISTWQQTNNIVAKFFHRLSLMICSGKISSRPVPSYSPFICQYAIFIAEMVYKFSVKFVNPFFHCVPNRLSVFVELYATLLQFFTMKNVRQISQNIIRCGESYLSIHFEYFFTAQK